MADFIIDDSIQTSTVFSQGNIFTTKTNPNLRLSSTAGLYYPSAYNFRIYTNSIDAFTIDSNQILYGNGAGLTNLNYNNISNPPNLSLYATTATLGSYSTTTQMNSSINTALTPYLTTATAAATYGTIANLNTKQNTLSASTTILGVGSNITSLNYANISNPPNLSQYALSTDLTTKQNTLTASTVLLGIGSSITALNYANISNPPNLSQYALSTDLTNKQNTLTSSTTLLGIGSSITALNYANISNPPNLSQYALSTDLTIAINNLNISGLSSQVTTNSNNISTLTTLVNNNKISINVKDYGAIGDGITDDTTAINNAVSALPNDRGILYFPSGRYLISSSRIYILNKTNLTIKSDNAFLINDFNGHTIFFDRCHQLSFTGTLSIICNTGGRVDSHGIVIDRCDFSRIHNILIYGDFTYGLSLLGSGQTSYSLALLKMWNIIFNFLYLIHSGKINFPQFFRGSDV